MGGIERQGFNGKTEAGFAGTDGRRRSDRHCMADQGNIAMGKTGSDTPGRLLAMTRFLHHARSMLTDAPKLEAIRTALHTLQPQIQRILQHMDFNLLQCPSGMAEFVISGCSLKSKRLSKQPDLSDHDLHDRNTYTFPLQSHMI